MKKILLIALVALFSMPSFAKDSEFQIRWALNHEPVNYFDKVAKEFQKNVEKRTKGRVKIFMERETVAEADILSTVTKNAAQMGHVHTHFLEALNAEFEMFQLPFLFDSDDHLTLFSQSAEGKKLFASLEAKGIYAVDYTYSGGQIGIYGPKINSMADLKGQSYNAENANSNYIDALKKLGINAQQLSSDLPTYDGLSKKIITSGESIPWMMGKILTNPDLKNVHFNRSRHRIVTRVLILSNEFLLKPFPKTFAR
jgi:TRAP-type C4-dicarboxylate transport system substrate-binding protein